MMTKLNLVVSSYLQQTVYREDMTMKGCELQDIDSVLSQVKPTLEQSMIQLIKRGSIAYLELGDAIITNVRGIRASGKIAFTFECTRVDDVEIAHRLRGALVNICNREFSIGRIYTINGICSIIDHNTTLGDVAVIAQPIIH